ncbi:hypothetical protein, partial [Fischerella thermalis]|uniref:hypothetical protein n=1 Tax=Fischerella thermalis TaxID=372787 RepID=UPI00241F759C
VWRDQVRVSPELANILDRMVRCHFGGRYQSATEALSALQSLAPPATITKFFNMLTKLFHI